MEHLRNSARPGRTAAQRVAAARLSGASWWWCQALLWLALGLAGCANPARQVGPLPYSFQSGQFTDARPNDDYKLMAVQPFLIENFWNSWQRVVTHNAFAQAPAVLNIRLEEYESTRTNRAYAMSLRAVLTAHAPGSRPGETGPVLAKAHSNCSIVASPGFDLAASLPQVWAQASGRPLTAEAQAERMWQRVMDACVSELASDLANQLAQ